MATAKTVGSTKIVLLRGDITDETVDAIVNAANSGLRGGGGVDGAIHKKGGPAILQECLIHRGCPTGQAVITTGGNLSAAFVIHAVGPVWHGGSSGEPELLASAYSSSLKRAVEAGLKTVAFPSISTGAYGYPVALAARVALGTVAAFCSENHALVEVRFVLFDAITYDAYCEALDQRPPE